MAGPVCPCCLSALASEQDSDSLHALLTLYGVVVQYMLSLRGYRAGLLVFRQLLFLLGQGFKQSLSCHFFFCERRCSGLRWSQFLFLPTCFFQAAVWKMDYGSLTALCYSLDPVFLKYSSCVIAAQIPSSCWSLKDALSPCLLFIGWMVSDGRFTAG